MATYQPGVGRSRRFPNPHHRRLAAYSRVRAAVLPAPYLNLPRLTLPLNVDYGHHRVTYDCLLAGRFHPDVVPLPRTAAAIVTLQPGTPHHRTCYALPRCRRIPTDVVVYGDPSPCAWFRHSWT